MTDRVIWHIGPRKTGTTYLQNILWANRPRLAEQGAFLPLESVRMHFEAASNGRKGWWTTPETPQRWGRLVREVEAGEGTAIVSTEVFAGNQPHQLERMLADHGDTPVEVVFGVRELARQIPAEWQQTLRARSTTSYDDWLAALRDDRRHPFWRTQDAVALLETWRRLVPLERISVVVVPRSAKDPAELWRRFAAATGLDPEGFDQPPGGVNDSLGIVQAELLRRLNASLGELSVQDYQPLRRQLSSGVLRGVPDARKPVLPAEHRDWVAARAEEMVGGLRASGVRVYGDLGDLAVQLDAPGGQRMSVSDEEVWAEVVRTIRRLSEELNERDTIVTRLRRLRDRNWKQ